MTIMGWMDITAVVLLVILGIIIYRNKRKQEFTGKADTTDTLND